MTTKAEIMANNHIKLEKKKDPAIKWLEDNFGKHDSGIELTKEELDKIAREMTPEKSIELGKKYGLIKD